MISLTIYMAGAKWWFCNNQCHRTSGPAITAANGYKAWYINDQRHRLGGPAIIYHDKSGIDEFWINGHQVTEYEHMFLTAQELV